METMQKAGVPAGLVLDPRDQLEDPQLKHRGHFIVAEGHPNVGPIMVDAPQVHMSKTPPQGGPAYGIRGQANEYVYKEMLGMSDREFNQCLEEGVFE
jgi:benzylsuccinate CoA-transferase BbsF subunit